MSLYFTIKYRQTDYNNTRIKRDMKYFIIEMMKIKIIKFKLTILIVRINK